MEYYYSFSPNQDTGVLSVEERETNIIAATMLNPVRNVSSTLQNNEFTINGQIISISHDDALMTTEDVVSVINSYSSDTAPYNFRIIYSGGVYYLTTKGQATIKFTKNVGPMLGLTYDQEVTGSNLRLILDIDAFMGATHFTLLNIGFPIDAPRILIEYSKPKKRRLSKNTTIHLFFPRINKMYFPVYKFSGRVTFFTE